MSRECDFSLPVAVTAVYKGFKKSADAGLTALRQTKQGLTSIGRSNFDNPIDMRVNSRTGDTDLFWRGYYRSIEASMRRYVAYLKVKGASDERVKQAIGDLQMWRRIKGVVLDLDDDEGVIYFSGRGVDRGKGVALQHICMKGGELVLSSYLLPFDDLARIEKLMDLVSDGRQRLDLDMDGNSLSRILTWAVKGEALDFEKELPEMLEAVMEPVAQDLIKGRPVEAFPRFWELVRPELSIRAVEPVLDSRGEEGIAGIKNGDYMDYKKEEVGDLQPGIRLPALDGADYSGQAARILENDCGDEKQGEQALTGTAPVSDGTIGEINTRSGINGTKREMVEVIEKSGVGTGKAVQVEELEIKGEEHKELGRIRGVKAKEEVGLVEEQSLKDNPFEVGADKVAGLNLTSVEEEEIEDLQPQITQIKKPDYTDEEVHFGGVLELEEENEVTETVPVTGLTESGRELKAGETETKKARAARAVRAVEEEQKREREVTGLEPVIAEVVVYAAEGMVEKEVEVEDVELEVEEIRGVESVKDKVIWLQRKVTNLMADGLIGRMFGRVKGVKKVREKKTDVIGLVLVHGLAMMQFDRVQKQIGRRVFEGKARRWRLGPVRRWADRVVGRIEKSGDEFVRTGFGFYRRLFAYI